MKENIKGFLPEDTLMIGDTYNTDIIGGNNAGIDICWLGAKADEADASYERTYTITNIKALLDIYL